jgi:hypothetical protein
MFSSEITDRLQEGDQQAEDGLLVVWRYLRPGVNEWKVSGRIGRGLSTTVAQDTATIEHGPFSFVCPCRFDTVWRCRKVQIIAWERG